MEVGSLTHGRQTGLKSERGCFTSIIDRVAPTNLLNTPQAAELLGIAPATLTVWRSTNRRVLAYVKIGSQVRYRREDLEKFISANLCNA